MNKNPGQNITTNVVSNSGSVQITAAGRDAYISSNQSASGDEVQITDKEALTLIDSILNLIKESNLPEKPLENAKLNTKLSKLEADSSEPKKNIIADNLKNAIELIKGLSETTDEAKTLIQKLRDPVIKLAGWLGIAFATLL